MGCLQTKIKKNYNKSVLSKLITITKKSRGYFIPGLIYNNESERDYLKKFIAKHPFFFKVVFKNQESRTPIYRITNTFNDYYNVENSYLISDNILMNIAWISFFLDKQNEITYCENDISYRNRIYIIDDFKDNVPGNISNKIIITIPQRQALFDDFSLNYTIGPYLFRTWVRQVLNVFLNQNCKISVDQSLKKNHYNNNLLHNSHIPSSEFECHQDQRSYPGVANKITGLQKWKMDKYYLENNDPLPKDYKIGVYV